MSGWSPYWQPLTHPETPPHDNYKFQLWGLIFGRCNSVILLLKLILAVHTPPQMHHGIYIMGCIWQPFWILQEKVGISFYFCIIRFRKQSFSIVQSCQMKTLSTPPDTPDTPTKHTHMIVLNFIYDNYKFQLWGLIWGRHFLLFLKY